MALPANTGAIEFQVDVSRAVPDPNINFTVVISPPVGGSLASLEQTGLYIQDALVTFATTIANTLGPVNSDVSVKRSLHFVPAKADIYTSL